MIIIVHSDSNDSTIRKNFGRAEYSYYFVLKAFLPILQKLGKVIQVEDPETEVDPIYFKARESMQHCVFMSFTPPHKTYLGNHCPTIPVLAWEFNTIPSEQWDNEPRHDWRLVLGKLGQAITHSTHSVQTIRAAMRDDYPVASIPSPVWDRYYLGRARDTGYSAGFDMTVRGYVVDSHADDFQEDIVDSIEHYYGEATQLHLDGVVYTSILNPLDGRKNWKDIISAFSWAFPTQEDATLVLKLTCNHTREWPRLLEEALIERPSHAGRIIIINGYLDDDSYKALAENSSYAVNASHGEGQCLPLMEYMSSGSPAISPCHTGMADYVNDGNSFIISSSIEPSIWPDDTRGLFRTTQFRISWESLRECFQKSYDVARSNPSAYEMMSGNAVKTLEKHCSTASAHKKLKDFFEAHKQLLETGRRL